MKPKITIILFLFAALCSNLAAQTFTISAQCGNNGSIFRSGEITVNRGSSQTFTFAPVNSSFQIWEVLIDYSNNSAAVSAGSYTFSNVITNHTIQVSFRLKTQPTFSGGAGTEASPYLISSKLDMVALANAVDGGTDYYDTYFLLTTDLTGANAVNTSVGSTGNGAVFIRSFQGVFNGNGHIIEMNSTTGGVFGYAYGAIIQNLGVKGTIAVSVSKANAYAGGICNDGYNSTISYCYNTASISVYSSSSHIRSYAYSGGISARSGTVSNCYNTGTVSAETTSSYSEAYSAGISWHATVSNCYNFGNISAATAALESTYSYAAGIGGYYDITNCFAANASISAKRGGSNYSGAYRIGNGSVYYGTVNNCYALSTMTINGSTVSSTAATSSNGANATLADFQTQSWIQSNLEWNFSNIWQMSGSSSPTQGLPIFKQQMPTYTITASADANGSISPSGPISVNQGSNQSFTFTANTGYEISQVLVDGENNSSAVANGNYTFYNVMENHTILVMFKQKKYSITAFAENNGTISPSGLISIPHGDNQSFTFMPNTGYEINQVLIDGENNSSAVSSGSYTFSNVTANHTISVSFKQSTLPQYTITASAGSEGSISPSGPISVNHGDSKTFTFVPNTDYEINQVLIDDVNNTSAVSSGSYTFSDVTANHTISVSFKQKQYTITASAESGGTISLRGSIVVNYGGNQTFTFTPNAGYEINQVLIDNVNNSLAVTNGSYTFSNVTTNHTIFVSFKQIALSQYTITASAGSGGNISQSGAISVTHGTNQSFSFTPNDGYEINQVLIDNVNNPSAVSSGSYTFSNITANHSISVTFKQKQYAITTSAGSGGAISPGGTVTVNHSDNQTFTFTPNTGYEINQVLIDNVNNPLAATNGSYTFTNVTDNHSISVTFKQKQYAITTSTGSGGAISPSGSIIVNYGDSQSFTFTANTGYEINQVVVDGENNSSAVSSGSYTFFSVTANHTISVSFKQSARPQYTITASAGSGGSLSPNGSVTVVQGDSQAFYFYPNPYYAINQVLIDNVNNASAASSGSYTFSNVTANHTIYVSFNQQPCIPNLVVQVWDDVLSVINQPGNNGGYTFRSYQWQRNGEDIPGAILGNLYIPAPDDAQYTVQLIDNDGQALCSCPVSLHPASSKAISAYPNPTAGTLTIESVGIRDGDKIEIYSVNGLLVGQYRATTKQTTLDVSSLDRGMYTLKVNNEQVKIVKINK